MPANLSFDALKAAVAAGEIDTVVTCIVDMQGRLMGKRFHAQHFLDSAHEETHCCNYLLATDMEMVTVPGYKAKLERIFRVRLEAFDWNCPQHLTPRYTEAQVLVTGAQGLIPDEAAPYGVTLEWQLEGGDWKLFDLRWK